MLDFIYYPVSGILWFWHRVFGYAFGLGDYDKGSSNGIAWALSVVFLVFTLRAILYKPFIKQVRTTRQMQELQPQIKALRKKYGKDQQKMAAEMQKLQKEHGFNPLMGCLPMLAQAPVFIGLYHVLRSFNRTSHGFGQLGLSPDQNAHTANYFFSVADVQSFLSARLFGAPISAAITTPKAQLAGFEPFGGLPDITNMIIVSVPLMIIASLATHFNARASVARQTEAAAANPQSAIMNKLALWIFPLGVLVGGPFLPIAILLYWVSNNMWTYGQQHLVFGKIDKEEEEKKQAAIERRSQNAPKPGAKPTQGKKALVEDESVDDSPDVGSTVVSETPTTPKPGQKPVAGAGGNKQKKPNQNRSGQKSSGNRGRANQKKRR